MSESLKMGLFCHKKSEAFLKEASYCWSFPVDTEKYVRFKDKKRMFVLVNWKSRTVQLESQCSSMINLIVRLKILVEERRLACSYQIKGVFVFLGMGIIRVLFCSEGK